MSKSTALSEVLTKEQLDECIEALMTGKSLVDGANAVEKALEKYRDDLEEKGYDISNLAFACSTSSWPTVQKLREEGKI